MPPKKSNDLSARADVPGDPVPIAFRRSGQRRGGRKTELELTGLTRTQNNEVQVEQIQQALMFWSSYMLDISPGFMGRLYAALAEEWTQYVRGVLYEWNDSEPREQTSLALNGVVLTSLWKAQGDEKGDTWERSAEELQALREACLRVFRRLAGGSEQGLPDLTSSPDNVVDFLCWRQARPRPIRKYAEDAEGDDGL